MTAKRNILIALMLLLIVAASACALAACNNTDSTEIGAQIATDNNGDPLYGGASYVMPEGMAFSAAASTAAEINTSVTLTASYSPSGTTNKQTNWSVYFKNPSSSWANGKAVTDYVTVQSTGTNTAKVTCLDSFGEQIIIKATSAADSSVYATTTVDFEKKVEDIRFDLYCDGSLTSSLLQSQFASENYSSSYFDINYIASADAYYDVSVKIDYSSAEKDYDLRLTPIFSDYTIDKTICAYYESSLLPGTENGLSGHLIAESYFKSAYHNDFPEVMNDLVGSLKSYAANQDNYASLNTLQQFAIVASMEQNTRYFLEWADAGGGTSLSGDAAAYAIGFYSQSSDFQEVYEASDGDMEYVFKNYRLLPSAIEELNKLEKQTFYMGEAVDIGNASSVEDYFSDNAAISYGKVSYGSYNFVVSFRFNPDSL